MNLYPTVQVAEALEGVDFTPVSFFKGFDNDPEKVRIEEKPGKRPESTITVPLPVARQPLTSGRQRGSSIYSDPQVNPIVLSSSPPLVSELGPAPSVKSGRGRSLSKSSSGITRASTFLPPGLDHTATSPERGAEDGPVITQPPVRSSSIASRASSRRKLQKQGLPTHPRPGAF